MKKHFLAIGIGCALSLVAGTTFAQTYTQKSQAHFMVGLTIVATSDSSPQQVSFGTEKKASDTDFNIETHSLSEIISYANEKQAYHEAKRNSKIVVKTITF